MVARRLDPGIEEIAEGAAGQEQAPGESRAEGAAQEDDKAAADSQVAEEVESIGMEGEGGDGAPPLSGHDCAGIGVAVADPVCGR